MSSTGNQRLCRFFMEGYCEEGKDCKFTHSSSACKFFYFDGDCPDGKKCQYSHTEIQKLPIKKENNQQIQNKKNNNNNTSNSNPKTNTSNKTNENKGKQQQQQQEEKKEVQVQQNQNQKNQKQVLYRVKEQPQEQQKEEERKENNNNNNKKDNRKQNQYRERDNNNDRNNDDRHNNERNNNDRHNNDRYNNKNHKNNDRNNQNRYKRKQSDEDEYYNYKSSGKSDNNNKKYNNNSNNRGNINGNNNNIKVNTESFDPDYVPADVKIRTVVYYPKQVYSKNIESREVLMVPNRFQQDVDDLSIYNGLLKEIKQSGKEEKMWKLWHGDNHLIADDKITWKKDCPTFNMVIDAIRDYFKMDIKATRLNWYRDSSEWKPYHHDAAAVKPERAKTQNLTVGVSFGAERELAFEHAKNRCVVTFPQPNGSMIAFSKDVNIMWRHGVPQVPPENKFSEGRISIIAWGWVDNMVDV